MEEWIRRGKGFQDPNRSKGEEVRVSAGDSHVPRGKALGSFVESPCCSLWSCVPISEVLYLRPETGRWEHCPEGRRGVVGPSSCPVHSDLSVAQRSFQLSAVLQSHTGRGSRPGERTSGFT